MNELYTAIALWCQQPYFWNDGLQHRLLQYKCRTQIIACLDKAVADNKNKSINMINNVVYETKRKCFEAQKVDR